MPNHEGASTTGHQEGAEGEAEEADPPALKKGKVLKVCGSAALPSRHAQRAHAPAASVVGRVAPCTAFSQPPVPRACGPCLACPATC